MLECQCRTWTGMERCGFWGKATPTHAELISNQGELFFGKATEQCEITWNDLCLVSALLNVWAGSRGILKLRDILNSQSLAQSWSRHGVPCSFGSIGTSTA